jgi:hypothetical protein
MSVKVELVFDVEEDESEKHEDEYDGSMEAEEGNKRPKLKGYDEFELYWETWILYLLVEYLLASDWLIFILGSPAHPSPDTVDNVNVAEYHLYDNE